MSLSPIDDDLHRRALFHTNELDSTARRPFECNRALLPPLCCKVGKSAAIAAKCIIAQGHSEEEKTRRFKRAVASLTKEEFLKITYSRVLAVIIKTASGLVFSSNPQLSYSFKHEIVVEWAAATYQSLWNQEFSSQHGASAVLLSKISFFSAFLADVHIERVISIMSFYNLIHFTLEHIRSQEHFNIFIIHFLARNFIGNGRKLTQEVWHRISMKWDSLKVFDQPNDIVEAIMCLLYREGVEQERSCGTSWSRLPCEAADLFRDGLVNKVDDDEGMAVDGEVYGAMDEYLEEYPMEDIEESLQDVFMD